MVSFLCWSDSGLHLPTYLLTYHRLSSVKIHVNTVSCPRSSSRYVSLPTRDPVLLSPYTCLPMSTRLRPSLIVTTSLTMHLPTYLPTYTQDEHGNVKGLITVGVEVGPNGIKPIPGTLLLPTPRSSPPLHHHHPLVPLRFFTIYLPTYLSTYRHGEGMASRSGHPSHGVPQPRGHHPQGLEPQCRPEKQHLGRLW